MDIASSLILALFAIVVTLQQYIINAQSSAIRDYRKVLEEQKENYKQIKIYALHAVIKDSVEVEDYERANRANELLKEIS